MHVPCLLFAYFGPETVLPMTSFIATVVGCGMMFGRFFLRHIVGFCRMVWQWPRRGVGPAAHYYQGPHTALTEVADHAMAANDVIAEQPRQNTATAGR